MFEPTKENPAEIRAGLSESSIPIDGEGALSNVFVSYSKADREFVEALYERLQKTKKNLRSDPQGSVSEVPAQEIFSRIEAAEFFIFVISPDSITSSANLQELEHAVANNKQIVPLLRRELKTESLPPSLSGIPQLYFRKSDNFERAYQSLMQKIDINLKISIFISYSRKDSDFVTKLDETLRINGRKTWLDQKSIRYSEKWLNAIYSGIEAADNFVFIISPDSLSSTICSQELRHALKHNKRLIPVLRREVNPNLIPEALKEINWLPFREEDNFESVFRSLLNTIDTDLDYVHKHTRLLTQAIDWERSKRSRSLLLRGRELRAANKWLSQARSRKPPSTSLQQAYIRAGNRVARTRFLTMLSAILVIAAVLSTLAYRAWLEQKFNESGKLASRATAYLSSDPELSLRLALASAETYQTEQSEGVLREALAKAPLREMQISNSNNIEAIFSPDNKSFLITSMEKSVHLFEVSGRDQGLTLNGHNGTVNNASFSPDGRRIVTASADHTARVWSTSDGLSQLELLGHTDAVNTVSFSPDGAFILTASDDNTARVWDANNGQTLLVIHGDKAGPDEASFMRNANYSPDGRFIVTVSYARTAHLWDAITGGSLHKLQGHRDILYSAAFSPDSNFLVTASEDKTAKVWSTTNGRKVLDLTGHAEGVNKASFSHDGKFVMTASSDNSVRVFDTINGQISRTFKGHTRSVENVSLSRDDKYILTWSFDGTSRLWDFNTGRSLKTWGNPVDIVKTALFSPDDALVLTVNHSGKARIWDISIWKPQVEFRPHQGIVHDVAFSPDGKFIATAGADYTARIWHSNNGKPALELKGHTNQVYNAVFSSDGKLIVTASIDRTARVWNADSSELLQTLKGHERAVKSARFSPDGKFIITASEDNSARLWEVSSGRTVRTLLHKNFVNSVDFRYDGKFLLTASGDNVARVWETNGQQILELNHADSVNTAVFSLDGKSIVTSSNNQTAQVWDLSSGRYLVQLREKDNAVNSAVFSSDGKLVLTASGYNSLLVENPPENGNIVRVWEIGSGRPIWEMTVFGDNVGRAVFSPDNKRIAAASWDGMVRIYACEICAQFTDLINLAHLRVKQTLTAEERIRALEERGD